VLRCIVQHRSSSIFLDGSKSPCASSTPPRSAIASKLFQHRSSTRSVRASINEVPGWVSVPTETPFLVDAELDRHGAAHASRWAG